MPYDNPRSDSSLMEATDDWMQYAIDKPMAAEPGKIWNYRSVVMELLAYIFQEETGHDIVSKVPDSTEYVWMCRGFRGQNLLVFPKEGLIVTFTAWDMLPNSTGRAPRPSDFLPLVKAKTCTGSAR